ncbi:MAG TPA: TetR/AcrR family transcriptional regulator [Nitrolancea sp.]|nr:TetR/AcrR family transcriptional regulator [Nitrolancea sp.]
MPGTKIAEALRREQIIRAACELATRHGLQTMTIRDVARVAETSPGLVIFHFGTKERLVLAMLDSVLDATVSLTAGPEILAIEDPLDRLIALVRQELSRVLRSPRSNRVFLELWTQGPSMRGVRTRMQRALDRYREAFRPFISDVLHAYPDRFAGVSIASLTTIIVSLVKGAALQSLVETRLDVDGILTAAERVLTVPAPASTAPA